jgi:hypothetical protein
VRAVRIIGQGGRVRSTWPVSAPTARGTAVDTTVELRTVAREDDGYLRVVAEGTDEWLYTNPVIRWNGSALPTPLATVNTSRTVLRQTLWRLLFTWLALWWLAQLPRPRWLRPRRPVTTPV